MHSPNSPLYSSKTYSSSLQDALHDTSVQISKLLEGRPDDFIGETHKRFDDFFELLKNAHHLTPYIWDTDDYEKRLLNTREELDQACSTFLNTSPFSEALNDLLSHIPEAIHSIVIEKMKDLGVLDLAIEHTLTPEMHPGKNFMVNEDTLQRFMEASTKQSAFSKTSPLQQYLENMNRFTTLWIDDFASGSQLWMIFEELCEYFGHFSHITFTPAWASMSKEIRKKLISSLGNISGCTFTPQFLLVASQELIEEITNSFPDLLLLTLSQRYDSPQILQLITQASSKLQRLRMIRIFHTTISQYTPDEIKAIFHTTPHLKALVFDSSDFSICSEEQIQALFQNLPLSSLSIYWHDLERTPDEIVGTFQRHLPSLTRIHLGGIYDNFPFSKSNLSYVCLMLKNIPHIKISTTNLMFRADEYAQLGQALAHCETLEFSGIEFQLDHPEQLLPLFAPLAQVKTIRVDEPIRKYLKNNIEPKLPFLKAITKRI